MATILVVDDRAANRHFLLTLLSYKQHRLLEAGDGAEGLIIVKRERPDLVIADVLMPTMDGYELVRQLRADPDPDVAATTVVFYTAHYLEREARALAEACGVEHVVLKPSEPQEILDVVESALTNAGPKAAVNPLQTGEFDQEHLRLITDKLSQKNEELRSVNQRLNVLIELSLALSSERDLDRLIDSFCHSARDIVGAKYSIVEVFRNPGEDLRFFHTSGMDRHIADEVVRARADTVPLLRPVIEQRQPLRSSLADVTAHRSQIPFPILSTSSWLVVPVVSPTKAYGWLCLLDKMGSDGFSNQDEKLASILAAQVGRVFENGTLYADVQQRSAALEQEIAERKRIEEALRVTERQSRGVFDSALEGMTITDDDGRVVDANPAACNLFGLSKHELIGMNVWDFAGHESELKQLWLDFLQKGWTVAEFRILRPDGSERDVEYSAIANVVPGRHLQVERDVTERKLVQDALLESEARFRRVVESDMVGIVFWDLDGVITFANNEFLRMAGRDKDDVTACKLNWEQITPAAYREMDKRAVEELNNSGRCTPYEKELVRHDGTRVQILIGGATLSGFRDLAVAFVIDISTRKQLEEQLVQAQKMEAVGRLAGGIAHDFNNLLTAILGYSQLMLLRLPEGSPMRMETEEIQKAGNRAAALTGQLLAFSRKQVMQSRVFDINSLIAETENMLNRLIGEDVELITSFEKESMLVKADPGQITQVILNLAINSRDAIREHGKITIETSSVKLDESYASQHIDVVPGSYVMLAVSDNGCGMDQATIPHIFEPFFTSKSPEKGTGLGLATVYGVIKQSGGHIWVYSEPNVGTTFKIYLPELDELNSGLLDHDSARVTVLGHETVLLVEDEEMLRKLIRIALESNGYKVLEAKNGKEALSLSEQCKEEIHLLLTDVIMPHVNGRELATRLMASRPATKVLYMSGYTDRVALDIALLEANEAYIQKPFTPDVLARKVRRILDSV
jgi:two-component system, cell cycle sensor histidine kinase and response regulator CckA